MADTVTPAEVASALRDRREVALLDVRPEGLHALAHPLFAASMRLGNLELEALDRIPRPEAPIVVFDDGERYAERAIPRLRALGYEDIALLEGGLGAWRDAGLEVYRDVNVPSKAFGELVAEELGTPMMDPRELDAALERGEDLVVVDVRRFDEYQTMSVPGATSLPGGELVYRIDAVAPRAETTVVVNCAGRTRSIIGTQSLVNAGTRHRVIGLRNGTIGWSLAGLRLDEGAAREAGAPDDDARQRALAGAERFARAAGVHELAPRDLAELLADGTRTVYRFDIRSTAEYEAEHAVGFRHAPGGQLVQETDGVAAVRGAAIVLADDDGVRARMTGAWLAQMGWDVSTFDLRAAGVTTEAGPWIPHRPAASAVEWIEVSELAALTAARSVDVVDLAGSPVHARGHVPGAVFVWPEELRAYLDAGGHDDVVLTSTDGQLAAFTAADPAGVTRSSHPCRVRVLAGGTRAWEQAGEPLETGDGRMWSPPTDVYRRPYEGVDVDPSAMQSYLDWEFGLVEQLGRDGTHHFRVVRPLEAP